MRFIFSSAVKAAAIILLTTFSAVAQESAGSLYPGVISSLVAPAGNISVGAAAHGFAASLSASPSTVRAGQPIVLSLEVRNVSKHTQWLYRPECPENYTFVVTNLRSGQAATVDASDCGDLFGSPIAGLDPGESEFLRFKFSDQVIARPARYRISLASVTWYPNSDAAPQKLKLGSTAVNVTVSP
jgi:hypothetical protein